MAPTTRLAAKRAELAQHVETPSINGATPVMSSATPVSATDEPSPLAYMSSVPSSASTHDNTDSGNNLSHPLAGSDTLSTLTSLPSSGTLSQYSSFQSDSSNDSAGAPLTPLDGRTLSFNPFTTIPTAGPTPTVGPSHGQKKAVEPPAGVSPELWEKAINGDPFTNVELRDLHQEALGWKYINDGAGGFQIIFDDASAKGAASSGTTSVVSRQDQAAAKAATYVEALRQAEQQVEGGKGFLTQLQKVEEDKRKHQARMRQNLMPLMTALSYDQSMPDSLPSPEDDAPVAPTFQHPVEGQAQNDAWDPAVMFDFTNTNVMDFSQDAPAGESPFEPCSWTFDPMANAEVPMVMAGPAPVYAQHSQFQAFFGQ